MSFAACGCGHSVEEHPKYQECQAVDVDDGGREHACRCPLYSPDETPDES